MSVPDPLIGQVLDGRYRIISKLGEGGMGEVYAAEHVHIEKRVAVKLLRNEIVQNEEAVTRFRQEARSASSIGHKNIAGIEDFGKLPDGRLYLCMELLNGQPLNEMLEHPMDPARLINILIQTGHGLAAAHLKGIIHRDMKPENIFVTHDASGQDVPKLLDFGIAKVSQSEGNNHLTKTGTIFGTPFYMAPEQALGQSVDARADVYAMGVIMYEAFCGAVPFEGDSFMAILTQHITAEPLPPAQMAAKHGRTIPPGVEEIILKAMKKEPEDRYQNMDEMVQALVTCYRGIAGSGMSSYMQAYVPPPTGVHPAASGVPTPAPYHPSDQSQPVYMSAGSGPMPGDSAFHIPKRKSKAGVFIAVFAVLAVLGGGAAFLVMSGKDGDHSAVAAGGTTDPNANGANGTDPNANGANGTDPNANGANGTDPNANGANGTDPNANGANGTDPNANGANGTDPNANGANGTNANGANPNEWKDVPGKPEARPVSIVVNSKPQGAVAYQDDLRVDKTPFLFKVIPGEPITLVLKKSGYEDEQLTLDGKKDRITADLHRKHSSSHGSSSHKTDKTDKTDKGDKTDSGGKGDGKDGKDGKDNKDQKFDPNKLEDGVLGG